MEESCCYHMAATCTDAADSGDLGPFSPAKKKWGRQARVLRRDRKLVLLSPLKVRLLASIFVLFSLIVISYGMGSVMGWKRRYTQPLSTSFNSHDFRCGYTVIINTWKRNSLLKKAVAHYATCSQTDAIHVVWSETDPPSDSLKSYLRKILSRSQSVCKPNFRFELNEEDNLNNRFKPIDNLETDAIFSVDDDVLVPCSTLKHAFTVWKTAPSTMVGFVPRMHWLVEENDGVAYYKYGGWWSVWWMGTYSMVLSKAAFFHRKYLDMYTHNMSSSIHDYVKRERNCEDIAMSMLVANASGVPPIWVKGKLYEMGSYGISSLKGHHEVRNKCLNDFVSFYGSIPLVPTNTKVVDAREDWFWS